MCKKSTLLARIVFLLCLAGSGMAASVYWTDNGPDHLWSTDSNWDVKPTNQDGANVHGYEPPNCPIIDNTVAAVAKNVNLKSGVASGPTGTLIMTGGTLDLGDGTPYSKISPWVGNLWMGYFNTDETGKMDMQGGTINCGYVMVGGVGYGILEMTGGTINCVALEVIASNKAGGWGRAYIDGGVINMDELNLKDDAIVDVNGGRLVITGDATTIVEGYVSAGKLLAGGVANVELLDIDYDTGANKTTVKLYTPGYDADDLQDLSEHWLASGYDVVAEAPDSWQLAVHYMFEETAGATVADSSSNGYNATVNASNPDAVWNSAGYDGNGCIQFTGDQWLSVPSAAFSGLSSGVTVSVWLNHDVNEVPEPNNAMMFSAGNLDGDYDELDWFDGPDQAQPTLSEEQWYHYAFVKDCTTGTMRIYHDGLLVAQLTGAVELLNGAAAGDTTIGAETSGADGFFQGKMDDFRVYNYALSPAEVLYLAGGSSLSQPLIPVFSPIDLLVDEKIDLRDFAVLANYWLAQ